MTSLSRLASAAALAFLPLTAAAGPEGTYLAQGTGPGGQGAYSGTVTVQRTGQTYQVLWNVGGQEYIGTGLGASNVNGSFTMGPASPDDIAIAISYVTNGSFGLTFYVEQPNGQWSGIWTYGGAQQIGTETWTRQ